MGSMFILDNVPLSGYSTMRLGGPAAHLVEITNHLEVAQAVAWAQERNLPVIMVGDGSNIVWQDSGFPGLVMVNKISGFDMSTLDEDTIYVTVGGGENWDSVVERTVSAGLSGIEFLSLIPGTAGAAPVQNIGAYGGQLSNVLLTLEAFDMQTKQLINLRASECAFGYRTSRFKTTDRHRFLITAITFQLHKKYSYQNLYHSLSQYLEDNKISDLSPSTIRTAVIAVRLAKLPDPKVVANNGSFFQNPIISQNKLEALVEKYPQLAGWHSEFFWNLPDGNVKIAAGALLEYAGFKGVHDEETGMATWPAQALVLVNEHATSTADLLKFRQKILDKVESMYGIALEQEPELLP